MLQPQRRQNLFKDRDGAAAIKQSRVRRQPQLVVETTDKIEAKAVKGADPNGGGLIGECVRQTL
jgi:hypothetical protein